MATKRDPWGRRSAVIQLLLGFDVLAVPEIAHWNVPNDKGRELFLLRPEVKSPLSVDRLICPSVFQPEILESKGARLVLAQFYESIKASRALAERPVEWPESELNILGYWTNAQRMRSWLNKQPELEKLVRFPVAIGIFLDSATISDPLWQTVSDGGNDPTSPTQGWSSLGYDVADRGQISALSDCSYASEELIQARVHWGNSVNDCGLLNDLDASLEFKKYSDARVVEHAPFYLYEIFRLSSE